MHNNTLFHHKNQKENQSKYADILDLPHPVSKKHPQMPISDRAAQFAPFAALTGHGEAVKETARLTERKVDLDENLKADLDRKLQKLRQNLNGNIRFSFTYFLPDERKEGGEYVTHSGTVKKIDEYENVLVMKDGTRIRIDDILDIDEEIC